jgi:[ribosomal protein S5]-alanine N-acetyltransferase
MRISAKDFRVYLATLTTEDAEAIEIHINDPEVISGINNPEVQLPYRVEDATLFIGLSMQKYERREEFHLGVHLVSGELVGMCALFNIDNINKKCEIGYWLGKKHWGNGYAKEALRLIMDFGFSELKLNKIYASVIPENARSIKLLGTLGYVNEGKSRQNMLQGGKFVDELNFSILSSEHTEGYIDVVDY